MPKDWPLGMPPSLSIPAKSNSLTTGGSGQVAAYGSTLSPPRTMATGISRPSAAYMRWCLAPSWWMWQWKMADRGAVA